MGRGVSSAGVNMLYIMSRSSRERPRKFWASKLPLQRTCCATSSALYHCYLELLDWESSLRLTYILYLSERPSVASTTPTLSRRVAACLPLGPLWQALKDAHSVI